MDPVGEASRYGAIVEAAAGVTVDDMADAAYPQNIVPGFRIAGGYYGGEGCANRWRPWQWGLFPGFKLPIYVPATVEQSPQINGDDDGRGAVMLLEAMGVPKGSETALDLELRTDKTYVEAFGAVLNSAGYRVWPYGSESTVFKVPPLNGYWVAAYQITSAQIYQLLRIPHVRAVQWLPNQPPGYDVSWVKQWTERQLWA